MTEPGSPLPQWRQVDGVGSGLFETEDHHGVTWRLTRSPNGWSLAPRDEPGEDCNITAEHGLYYALDIAGLRISGDAVRGDPEGAMRQLGLGELS